MGICGCVLVWMLVLVNECAGCGFAEQQVAREQCARACGAAACLRSGRSAALLASVCGLEDGMAQATQGCLLGCPECGLPACPPPTTITPG